MALFSALLGLIALVFAFWDMIAVASGSKRYGGLSWNGLLFWLVPIVLSVLVALNVYQWRGYSRLRAQRILRLCGFSFIIVVFAIPHSTLRLGLSLCCCHENMCPDRPSHLPSFAAAGCLIEMEDCSSGVYRQMLQLLGLWLALFEIIHTCMTQRRLHYVPTDETISSSCRSISEVWSIPVDG
ncbi:hypothetical protein Ae201684P_021897 [Aphanomyces euteiches]|uniref:Uncharacterized protein n=1 Tax=Aphanomyces euteiches TaxID=100861 RepID=A0A6G0WSX6_9STRA|nr:hypothetical protein Ae201684_012017 [Aphanomyces euteiches]KAH9056160.1 hypothetical protein Ae201684P_021897 [Aphanomyces euteiches]KAH9154376.1 hypothetical protein AeRB84_003533 [Aphanomyces euteiches]